MRIRLSCLVALALLIGVVPAIAQERSWRPDRIERRQERLQDRRQDQPAAERRDRSENAPPASAESDPQGVLRLLPADAVSEKQIAVDGRPFAYTATAGTLPLYNQNGDRIAAVFYTAYVAMDRGGANRPITFAFNGGPGAASAYLHLGLAGPRIVDFGPDGRDGMTAKLRDNPETWLAFTDLVMIDPVSTGWSRPTRPDGTAAFRGVQSDANSIAKVIALYVAKNNRAASPKYLLGESYGGFRAAKVARVLKNDQGIIVAGIVMVSPMLETSYQWGRSDDPFKAALIFPSLVATELERTKKYTPEAMAEAEQFALNEYLHTLAGPPPSGEAARAFYQKIARYTGLPVETVAKSGGYVRSSFVTSLQLQGLHGSSYDLTFTIPDVYRDTPYRPGGDPMLDGFLKALSGVFVSYARSELGFSTDMTYTLLSREGGWDWGNRGDRPGVSDDLRGMLGLEPSFRLLVVHGRSDLVTPYGINRYLLDRIRPPGAPERVQLKTYSGGHMFYFKDAERRAFTADAKLFYQGNR
jgi:carboxypeptidase C (cathepsin A)